MQEIKKKSKTKKTYTQVEIGVLFFKNDIKVAQTMESLLCIQTEEISSNMASKQHQKSITFINFINTVNMK